MVKNERPPVMVKNERPPVMVKNERPPVMVKNERPPVMVKNGCLEGGVGGDQVLQQQQVLRPQQLPRFDGVCFGSEGREQGGREGVGGGEGVWKPC